MTLSPYVSSSLGIGIVLYSKVVRSCRTFKYQQYRAVQSSSCFSLTAF